MFLLQGGYKGQGSQTDLVGPRQRGEEVILIFCSGETNILIFSFGRNKYSNIFLEEKFPSRFVGAALLPLDDAVGNDDQSELTVHEAWLAIRESVEPELNR